MAAKIKIIAKTDQQNECFEAVFFDGADQIFGVLLKKLFESAGYRVVERRPDGMTAIWEVHLPAGTIVDETTVKTIDNALDIVGAPV